MALFRKIFGKLKFFLVIGLLRLAAAIKSPALAASAMADRAWRVPENANGKLPRVLCLGRTIFVDDIKAMARYSGQIEYMVVHLQYFEQIFQHFFSKKERAGITEENYHHDNTTANGKKAYAALVREVLRLLRRDLGIAAVMSGNFGYVVQQEVAAACASLGIPFIVMHKEGQMGFGGAEFASPYRTFRFPGELVLLYNEVAKKTLLESGMPGLASDKIQVVGAPRLDAYFIKSSRPAVKRQVVLFSFSAADRFHYISDPAQRQAIEERSKDFHRMTMEFAARHPDIEVIIKTKNARHYVEYVEENKRTAFPEGLRNLKITNSGKAMDLIADAIAVLGYNSTTLIEGVMSGKPVISPDFADLIPAGSKDFFDDYRDLLAFARSTDELERAILDPKTSAANSARREEFLRAYVYIPDGKASVRAEDAILGLIVRKSKEGLYV